MKPLRQIEAAELMVSGKNYFIAFAASIFGVTRRDQLVKPEKETGKPEAPHSTALLEETTDSLISDLAKARRTYGADVLTLSVVCRCLANLLQNAEVCEVLAAQSF
jgi:hypothetical protein